MAGIAPAILGISTIHGGQMSPAEPVQGCTVFGVSRNIEASLSQVQLINSNWDATEKIAYFFSYSFQ
ncbi:MAG: hypothetical protein CMP91_01005 [Gammaproteobacteria bacterium]|nr:hypothetical protein [Gammaproteobacteria bacterium]MAY03452.1 hypothetical protein [Gammaproteobacteria bacterium]